MLLNIRFVVYILSLLLGFEAYELFSKYLIFDDILPTGWPFVIFYGANIIFVFLSWFHFYKPRLGAILLTILVGIMFFVWLIIIRSSHFGYYKPKLSDTLLFLSMSAVTILGIWNIETEKDLDAYDKFILAAIPVGIFLYIIYRTFFF